MGVEDPILAASRGRKNGTRRSETSHRTTPLLPGAEPQLPPTAERLLDAAYRLLLRSGYNSLSVEAIGQEAGENKALIRYYFGSKNGLLVALTDRLISATLWQARRRLSGLSDTRDRVDVLGDTMEAIASDEPSYRLLFDLLPRLLENPRMTLQLAELYRGYREVNVQALWGDRPGDPPPAIHHLAAISVALPDGLAVQLLAEPGSVDVTSIMAMYRSFMEMTMAAATAELDSPAEPGGDQTR